MMNCTMIFTMNFTMNYNIAFPHNISLLFLVFSYSCTFLQNIWFGRGSESLPYFDQ